MIFPSEGHDLIKPFVGCVTACKIVQRQPLRQNIQVCGPILPVLIPYFMHILVEQGFLDRDKDVKRRRQAVFLAQQNRAGCGCLQDAQVPVFFFIDDIEIPAVPFQHHRPHPLLAGDIIRHKKFRRAVLVDIGRVDMYEVDKGFVAEGFDFLKALVLVSVDKDLVVADKDDLVGTITVDICDGNALDSF